jgi:molybdopterin synthase catalytic subunit/molybdopterin synthase sulfur carrier subunit
VATSVRLLAFAGARDVLGAPELDVALDGPSTAAQFLETLCARYPGLAPYRKALRLAVNGSYVAWGDAIAPGDEVALIPPVAGG